MRNQEYRLKTEESLIAWPNSLIVYYLIIVKNKI